MQDYLATVQSVDDGVGRVLDFLDRNGLSRNTVVIYTSDQGFFLGDHGLFDKRSCPRNRCACPSWSAGPRPSSPGHVLTRWR